MATETVITVPLVLFLFLLIVQFALAEHAQHIAQTAASRALATARTQGGSAAAGRSRAEETLDRLGHAVLQDPQITVTRTSRTAAVRVHGTVQQVVPGFHLAVTGYAGGAVEHWSTAGR
ncbi:TadE/TadG family type IV pilus assembly protein [Actinacidiphila sp. bgisy167]|uniref:TadE/TadG family type IV pilus assembly protein n=1 Tax=Actinacidiphila sp. bgisy167 TaxID=3413797 RepID=UPI003D737208